MSEFPTDLETALVLLSKLRTEKEEFRARFEESNVNSLELQQEQAALMIALETEQSSRESAEARYQQQVAGWEAELAERSAEIDGLRDKVLTQEDIDMLRFRLIEELERPHQERAANLEQELSRFRELYQKARRSHEMLKEQFDHQRVHTDQFQAELDNLRQAEVDDLRRKVEEMTAAANDEKALKEIRTLRRDITSYEMKIANLTAEIDELVAQKEANTREYDQSMRLKDRINQELAAKVNSTTSEIDSQRLHINRVQEELGMSQARLSEVKKSNHEGEKARIALQSAADEQAHRTETEIGQLKMGFTKRKGEAERGRSILQDALDTATRQVHMLEKALDEMKASASAKDLKHAAAMHEAREEEWSKQRELETSRLQLDARCRGLEKEMSANQERQLRKDQKAADQHRQCTQRVDALETERDGLKFELERAAGNLDELSAKLEQARLVKEEYELAKVEHATEHRELVAARRDMDELKSQLAIKDLELKQMQEEIDTTRGQLRKEADDVRETLAAALSQFTEKEGSMNEQFQALYAKFEALAKRYKSHRSKGKSDQAALEELVAGLESKLAGQQAAFTELQERDRRTTNDLREMERRVDQFKEVVRGEGRRQAAGVEASAKQVPKPFDDEQGRKNRAEIAALKENIDLVTGHTPEIFATGGM